MLLDKLVPRNWRQSKRTRDPFTGDCKIARNSSLRKLARAMRRGKVSDERQFIIDEAMKTARRRLGVYHYKRPPS
jgi:hypothetical protein